MPPHGRTPRGPALSRRASVARAARAYAYFTKQDLADELGVHRSTIDRWESASREPSDDQLAALCEACDLPGWRSLLERSDSLALRLQEIAVRAEELRVLAVGGEDGIGEVGDE